MPIYTFKNPKTGEETEMVQKMKENHVYVDGDRLEWQRVFAVPNGNTDTQLNDGSLKSFMRRTEGKQGTMGDLWDAARESSEVRKNKDGVDGVEQKHFKSYSGKRHGMKHENDKNKSK